jgi:hypothetical protein
MEMRRRELMNWPKAIERNRDAFYRIVAALFAMAALGEGETVATPPRFDFRPRYRRPKSFPRISIVGVTEPRPIRDGWIPSPDDPVGAGGVCRRLAALKPALDDLDKHARPLARWKAQLRPEPEVPARRLTRVNPSASALH